MLDQLNEIEKSALESLASVVDATGLEAWRVAQLGRSSPLMTVFAGLGKLGKEERPAVGQAANRVKVALESALEERTKLIKETLLAKSLEEEALDVTLPGRAINIGRLHPATQQLRRALGILAEMGFQVYTSREVETDEMNFQMLNFAPHHPAREMQDSFYVEAGARGDNPILMRTHTSPGQIRAMREAVATNPQNPPPIRIALPGMCFRYEQITARSEIQFNQVEGLAVGENITFSDLKGTLPTSPAACSGPRRASASAPRTSPSLNRLPRWMWNASFAAARAARSASNRAGWRFWDAAWCILSYCKTAAMTRSGSQASPFSWGLNGS